MPRTTSTVYRRRRVTAVIALAAVAALIAVTVAWRNGSEAANPPAARAPPTPTPPPQLPRGGRRILPDFRVVAYYGAPQDRELGALGIGKPTHAVSKLEHQAKPYGRRTRPILPALELLAVVAAGSPGEGG